MIPVRFTEGPPVLDMKLPDRWLLVHRGKEVEVTEDEAELLLTLPGWEATPKPPPPSEEDES